MTWLTNYRSDRGNIFPKLTGPTLPIRSVISCYLLLDHCNMYHSLIKGTLTFSGANIPTLAPFYPWPSMHTTGLVMVDRKLKLCKSMFCQQQRWWRCLQGLIFVIVQKWKTRQNEIPLWWCRRKNYTRKKKRKKNTTVELSL